MNPVHILKTVEVQDVDKQQTLLIIPADFLAKFSPEHVVTFQELPDNVLQLRIVGPHSKLYDKPYKLVTCRGATWVSVPRIWLRNMGARAGDRLDVFSVVDPDVLLVRYRQTKPY